jgi:pimeloyl-ACP methyl ester carboxylesterase
MSLVLPLQKSGYHLLLFDLRAHGASAGSRSTLGIDEAQDVIGAVDFLAAQQGVDGKRIGGWGRDIGAYALVLAARERASLRALALDGLFPSTESILGQRLFEGTGPLQAPLARLAGLEFRLIFGPRSPAPPAGEILPTLTERDLFLVVAREGRQVALGRSMLEAVPEGKNTEKNLLEVEAAWSQNLYGDDRARYEKEIKRFFMRTLPPEPGPSGESRAVQLLEG